MDLSTCGDTVLTRLKMIPNVNSYDGEFIMDESAPSHFLRSARLISNLLLRTAAATVCRLEVLRSACCFGCGTLAPGDVSGNHLATHGAEVSR